MSAVWQRVLEAHHEVASPTVIDQGHWVNAAIVVGCVMLILTAFHRIVAVRFKRQYFTLHVFANSIIVYLTYAQAWDALMNPASSTLPVGKPASQIFMCWCFALHLYHPIFFRTGYMDWVHHTPVYIVNFLMFGCLAGNIFCLQGIILTGLPGGLDYLLLVFEGEGWLGRARYKDLSANINNWFRAPLGFISGYACIVGLWQQRHLNASTYTIVTMILMGVHAMWNAPFFGRQAIEANIVDIINRFGLVGRSTKQKAGDPIKLPYVRGLSGKSNPKNKRA